MPGKCFSFSLLVQVENVTSPHYSHETISLILVLWFAAMTEEQDPPSYKAARKKDRERLAKSVFSFNSSEPVFRIRIGLNTNLEPAFKFSAHPDPGLFMTNIWQLFLFSQFSS